MLVLFDIDGTLTRSGNGRSAHWQVVLDAIGAHLGREVDRAEVGGVPTAGMTDLGIVADALEALTGARPARAVVDAVLADAARRFPAALREVGPPNVLPGATQARERLLDAGARVTLVTGNVEGIARDKLAGAGIGSYYEPGRGGFGCQDEHRERLVALAVERERDRGWRGAAGDVVVIGDTPRDIACAHANGAHAVAVATGPFAAGDLTAAEIVVGDLDEAVARLVG